MNSIKQTFIDIWCLIRGFKVDYHFFMVKRHKNNTAAQIKHLRKAEKIIKKNRSR